MDIRLIVNHYKFRDLCYPILRKFYNEVTDDDILYLTLTYISLENLIYKEILNNNSIVSRIILNFLRYDREDDEIVSKFVDRLSKLLEGGPFSTSGLLSDSAEVLEELAFHNLFYI